METTSKMDNLMEEIERNIKAILPNLLQQTVDMVVKTMLDSGVESINDLQYIQENDLQHLLKPIQSRKLLSAWGRLGEYY